MLRLPSPCLVVLVGPAGSGKSTWAAAHFPADQVVSTDRLRAVEDVIAIVYGAAKAGAVRAAVRGGYINSLVTHSALARAVLASG